MERNIKPSIDGGEMLLQGNGLQNIVSGPNELSRSKNVSKKQGLFLPHPNPTVAVTSWADFRLLLVVAYCRVLGIGQ